MIVDPSHIELSTEQRAELAELSAATGKPWPVVFHEALETYRHDERGRKNGDNAAESFFDAASRLGLIGCLSGGPADLSTNPAYLEGFGESND